MTNRDKWTDLQLEMLEDSDVVRELKKMKESEDPLPDWEYLKHEIWDILNGDWNLNFKTAEQGAAWMLLYICEHFKRNEEREISINFVGDFEIWINPVIDHVFTLKLEPLLKEMVENAIIDRQKDEQDVFKAFRNMLDKLEMEIAEAEQS